MNEAFWDERYRSAPTLWSGKPNPHLVAEAADLLPSSALDAATGEGADAIWLAERGWQVTAVDISTVALERGRSQAEDLGASIAQNVTWLHADLTEWEPPVATFGLVSVQVFASTFRPTTVDLSKLGRFGDGWGCSAHRRSSPIRLGNNRKAATRSRPALHS